MSNKTKLKLFRIGKKLSSKLFRLSYKNKRLIKSDAKIYFYFLHKVQDYIYLVYGETDNAW